MSDDFLDEDDAQPASGSRREHSSGARPDRRKWQVVIGLAVPLLILAAVLVVRNDGDSASREADQALARYCATVVERDSIRLPAAAAEPSEEDRVAVAVSAGRLILLTERMLEVAPEEAKPELESQVSAYREIVRSRDAAGLRSSELLASREKLNSISVRTCRFREVPFAATEFRYEGVPAEVGHGRVNFQMRNQGNEPHQMVLFRRNPEFAGEFSELLDRGEEEEEASRVVGLTVPPGASDSVTADLAGGDYAMACFLRSGEEAHWQKGMIAEFKVT